MQPRTVVGFDDFTAGRLDRQLALADRKHAGAAEQNHRDNRNQDKEKSVLHQRTPRARAGSSGGWTCTSGVRAGATVIVSFGMVTACGPVEINLSSGKYIMLLPLFVSRITLREFL